MQMVLIYRWILDQVRLKFIDLCALFNVIIFHSGYMEHREYQEIDQLLQGAVLRLIKEEELFFEQEANFHRHFQTHDRI